MDIVTIGPFWFYPGRSDNIILNKWILSVQWQPGLFGTYFQEIISFRKYPAMWWCYLTKICYRKYNIIFVLYLMDNIIIKPY